MSNSSEMSIYIKNLIAKESSSSSDMLTNGISGFNKAGEPQVRGRLFMLSSITDASKGLNSGISGLCEELNTESRSAAGSLLNPSDTPKDIIARADVYYTARKKVLNDKINESKTEDKE